MRQKLREINKLLYGINQIYFSKEGKTMAARNYYDVTTSKNEYALSENFRILTAFLASGLESKKVEKHSQRSAGNCAASLKSSRDRYRMGVDIKVKKGEVWLFRRKYSSVKEENES